LLIFVSAGDDRRQAGLRNAEGTLARAFIDVFPNQPEGSERKTAGTRSITNSLELRRSYVPQGRGRCEVPDE